MERVCLKLLTLVSMLFCLFSIPLYAQQGVASTKTQVDAADISEINKKIEKLEKALTKEKKRNKKRTTSIVKMINSEKDRLTFNGFMTAGLMQSSQDVDWLTFTYPEKTSFRPDAVLGIQTIYKISDKAAITAQMVANGYNEFDVKALWAYASYKVNDALTLRAGRMRLPFYLFSDSMDVGFAYPWVRPPIELYIASFSSWEAVDLLYHFSTGDWIHQIQFGLGTYDYNDVGVGIGLSGRDGLISNFTSSYGPWTLRVSYNESHQKIDFPGVPSSDDYIKTPFYSFGASYDDGNWLVLSEFVALVPKEGYIDAEDKMYVTVGKYFPRLLPYVTIGKQYSRAETDAYLPDYQSVSYSCGLRYEITTKMAAKFEYNHYSKFDDTKGPFFAEHGEDHIDFYTFVIDAVF